MSVPGVDLSTISLGVNPISFELLCCHTVSGSFSSVIVVIYRPGSVAVTSAFLDDLSEILDWVASYSDPVYIARDLNVPLDRRLTELFELFGFTVGVNKPTYTCGDVLDMVTTHATSAARRFTTPVCPTNACSNAWSLSPDRHCLLCQLFADHGICLASAYCLSRCRRRCCQPDS